MKLIDLSPGLQDLSKMFETSIKQKADMLEKQMQVMRDKEIAKFNNQAYTLLSNAKSIDEANITYNALMQKSALQGLDKDVSSHLNQVYSNQLKYLDTLEKRQKAIDDYNGIILEDAYYDFNNGVYSASEIHKVLKNQNLSTEMKLNLFKNLTPAKYDAAVTIDNGNAYLMESYVGKESSRLINKQNLKLFKQNGNLYQEVEVEDKETGKSRIEYALVTNPMILEKYDKAVEDYLNKLKSGSSNEPKGSSKEFDKETEKKLLGLQTEFISTLKNAVTQQDVKNYNLLFTDDYENTIKLENNENDSVELYGPNAWYINKKYNDPAATAGTDDVAKIQNNFRTRRKLYRGEYNTDNFNMGNVSEISGNTKIKIGNSWNTISNIYVYGILNSPGNNIRDKINNYLSQINTTDYNRKLIDLYSQMRYLYEI